MSGNHNRSLDRALKIVQEAANSGADAIKLQTYTADTMTLNVNKPGFIIDDPNSVWKGRQLYELYQEAHTPWEWHKPIIDLAKSLGMHCFSSPFDKSSVDFLEKLDVPAYKIASFEITDLPLIQKVAKTGKPMIISTGMASLSEIEEAIKNAKSFGCNNIALLKCTSTYPAEAKNSNIKTLPNMKEVFKCEIGLSDHTLDNTTAITSVALGCNIIEKHFTLDRNGGGPDDSFSMEPCDLEELVKCTKIAHASLGSVHYTLKSSEVGNIKFRRSLYFVKALKAGEVITRDSVRSLRPGYGIAPKHLESIIGLTVKADVGIGTAVTNGLFD